MLAARGVRLRANHYFWGGCLAIGALALLTISRLAVSEENDPGNSAGGANAARLEAEIQRLHAELESAKELLRQATSNDDELRIAQRGDGPPRANDPPEKSNATTTDGKKIDADAWRSLDKELARRHPGMRHGSPGGPPPWARHGFRGGPPWAHHHHHHHGHHHWARHGRHGGPHHWAHHHGHGRGRGGPAWARHHHRRPHHDRFGFEPRGGDGMPQIAQRLNLLERKIDALMHEVRGTHEGPDRDGPPRDGPPRDGPPRDGPPRDGAPRDAAPPRKPGE